MKNVYQFLLCFRPVVDILESEGTHHQRKKALTCNGIEDKEGYKVSMTKSSFTGINTSSKIDTESLVNYRPRKRSFSQVIKAVVFESTLAKRLRDRKRSVSINSDQRTFASSRDDIKPANQVSVASEIQEAKSSPVLSTSSSHGSTSSNSSTPSEPKNITKSSSDINNIKQMHHKRQEGTLKPKKEDNCDLSFNSGIYLLIITLTVTTLYGKACAILVTSVCLYFGTSRRAATSGICKPGNVTKLAKAWSRDYKKRVIMKGLLQRKPPHRAINF
ncbi:hypothetical protein CFOL_v3_14675 [Cephalotus follicularis]|uniref:Uncharacterized protein n=1 Tax=Cephalotus follicularis TaxID=3775 RepID=A0A1Q3BT88_CEPFO|nr:hypothetical protein CFOL_v3_14675 [Cephalotus follicularis]